MTTTGPAHKLATNLDPSMTYYMTQMVRFGADEIINAKGGTLSDEDIDALLARGEERTHKDKELITKDMQHTLANFSVQVSMCVCRCMSVCV